MIKASGIKFSTSSHVLIRDNVVSDNDGNGIWFDISSYDVNIVRNLAQRNFRNGIYVEITGTAIVASNLVTGNGQAGIKLSGATDTRVYNNTMADNLTYQMSVHDDGRDNTNSAQIALGITWDTARNTLINNILSAPAAGSVGALLMTEDLDSPKTVDASTMLPTIDDNLYLRSRSAKPGALVTWTRAAQTTPSHYASLSAWQAGEGAGIDPNGLDIVNFGLSPVFTSESRGDFRPMANNPGSGSGAPLPNDIAALVGVTAGVAVDRGLLVAPSAATAVGAPLVSDTYSRTVTPGWGVSDSGAQYSITGATSSSVDGATGSLATGAGAACAAQSDFGPVGSADLAVSVSTLTPTGSGAMADIVARAVDATHQYRARLRVTPSGTVGLAVTRLAGTTSETQVGTELSLAGVHYTAGQRLSLRVQVGGVLGVTTVRARAWLAGQPEPSTWQVTRNDTAAGLQTAGVFGLAASQSANATSPMTFSFDDFVAQTI